MPTDVLMPQMGESIAEGTIVRWIKSVGEPVGRDEPLFEISTDKVDAEVPSPAAGRLVQIRARAGETVPVNSVVAVIGAEGEADAGPAPAAEGEAVAAPAGPAPPAAGVISPADAEPTSGAAIEAGDNVDSRIDAPFDAAGAGPGPARTPGARLSPVVRRLAAEHGVDLSAVTGTGDAGRITKADVLAHVAARGQDGGGRLAAEHGVDLSAAAGTEDEGRVTKTDVLARGQDGGGSPGGRIEPMSAMRRRIAEHMVESRRTSAHAHTLFEVDFSGVAAARAAYPKGTAPGYLAWIAKAAADALAATPVMNASIDGANIVHHPQINLGIAVALDHGLIVPVVRQADRLEVEAIDAAIKDLAARARAKQLAPEDVAGGTFTITNPGGFGSLLGMPIINQPQVAILGVGAIDTRPAVVDGAVVARLRAFLTLGFDHRLIDGAVADRFMARIKSALEDPRWLDAGNPS